MYKSISSLNSKDIGLKYLALLPGFNYDADPIKVNETINLNSNILKNKDIIEEKIFIKFFGLIDKSNKYSRKMKKHSKQAKQSKKKR